MATALSSRLILNSPILLIELFTILLLGYISYGEVNIQYPHFVLGKMEAQAETIRTSLEPYLQAGIPLEQFSGFKTQAQTLSESDPDIEAIRVVNPQGIAIFARKAAKYSKVTFQSITEEMSPNTQVYFWQSEVSYRVVMPLEGKFGPVGSIELETSKKSATRVIDNRFRHLAQWSVILFVVFTVFILVFDFLSESRPALANRQKQVFNSAYFASFAIIVAVLVVSLFEIYNTGAIAKAKALADSMAQRVSAVLELNIELHDISGINESFRDYQVHHADISGLALVADDHRILFHTRANAIGTIYHIPDDSYEYGVSLHTRNGENLYLSVTIPVKVVRTAILAQAKQCIVLLVACGLLSWVFLDASGALIGQLRRRNHRTNETNISEDAIMDGLRLIKPAYFLIVFTSAMPMSFLPHLTKEMAAAVGTAYATATLPFTIYYFIFAAVLIPAGRFAARGNLKQMMGIGFLAELLGLLLIAAGGGYWLLTIGRIFSGFGQGVFLIGLNSYTLSITPKDKRTLGNTVKVNGRNAALISGTSIGALLFTYMSYQSLFLVASLINLIGMIYLIRLVPTVNEIAVLANLEQSSRAARIEEPKIRDDLWHVLRDPEFLRTLGLIGIIGKIGVAGVVMFAIPLILAERGVPSADIGLALMLFYIASIIVTRYASALVDRLDASGVTLFLSALIGGVGMLMMGMTGITEWHHPDTLPPGLSLVATGAVHFNLWIASGAGISHLSYWLMVTGIVLTGIANGLLSAPIMTHIDKTPVAYSYSNKAVAAIYLFLERAGHMSGPMVISGLLAFAYNTSLGITLFGIVTILFGIVFMLTTTSGRGRSSKLVAA